MSLPKRKHYLFVGKLEVFEAKRMLPRLDQEKIRYRVSKNWRGVVEMNPAASLFGGEFGGAAKVNLSVHREDQEKLMTILLEFFPV